MSRGISAHKLKENILWWHGPTILSDSNYNHTLKNSDILIVDDGTEVQEQEWACNLVKFDFSFSSELFKRYSNLYKLQKIIGY